jgi:dolichyl-phosphate-mannose-protein mannosyltransferase
VGNDPVAALSSRWRETAVSRAATRLALAGVLVIAATLRFWGLWYGLPHPLARPDEEIVVGHAVDLVLGRPDRAVFPYPELVYFVDPVRGRPIREDVTYAYPYPNLVYFVDAIALGAWKTIGEGIGSYTSVDDFVADLTAWHRGLQYKIARAVSACLGVGTVLAAYLAAWYGYRRQSVALLAALLVAVNFLHARDSHYATVDVPMTFFLTMSLAFALKAGASGARRDALLAAGFAGLAASAKFNGAAAIFATVVAVGRRFFGPPSTRRRWWVIATLSIAAVVMIVAFAVTSPYCIRDYKIVHLGLRIQRRVLFDTVATPAWKIFATSTFPDAFGWLGFMAVGIGVIRAVWKRRLTDVALLAFIVPTFLSMAWMTWVLPRYPLPLIAPLCVLAAEASLAMLPSHRRAVWAIAVTALLAVPPFMRIVAYDRLASRIDTRLQASDWIAQHIPSGSRIAVCRGYGAPMVNSDPRTPPAFERVLLLPCSVEKIRETGARYVMTQTHPVIPFFVPTDEARQWLSDRARPLATFSPFRAEGRVTESCFYSGDAFYLPTCGFDAVERGGPVVTVWDLGSGGN